ncbi:hypothetical protein [Sinomicrobium weinanense]|uniref:Uncharacterized protein n=1 Tax=Sinomicrobium weinanense TaxID=2842200 RepID=A0A926JRU0_9FLAO|nr:hypothetical protein [Sinomicrobium weinanense]MBC9796335.1 hypothetical protein [Sinomicrobium weinanense]MBU3122463.1 hypothetical protein [Sinomicrobium weinanense]
MKTTLCKRGFLFMALCTLIILGSCQPPEVEKPKKTIDKEQAARLSGRFVDELTELMEGTKDTARLNRMQKAGFVPRDNKADFKLASYTYYTVEELEHYFAWVKQEAWEKGYALEGYRFYFGIYPDEDDYGEKQNFMTMFISPAGRKAERQEGAVVNLSPVFYYAEEITEIDSYNYGGQGEPPSEKYAD